MEQLEGLIADIVFQSEDGMFCVLRIDIHAGGKVGNGDHIIAVGIRAIHIVLGNEINGTVYSDEIIGGINLEPACKGGRLGIRRVALDDSSAANLSTGGGAVAIGIKENLGEYAIGEGDHGITVEVCYHASLGIKVSHVAIFNIHYAADAGEVEFKSGVNAENVGVLDRYVTVLTSDHKA